jgi:hypothetical protein
VRLAVCSFVERPAVGTSYEAGKLPLHVTVLGNFTLEADHEVIGSIVRHAERMLPIDIQAASDERFGPDGEFRVTVAQPSAALNVLHHELLASAQRVGAIFDNPDFNGDGFRAHLTWLDALRPRVDMRTEAGDSEYCRSRTGGDGQLRRITETI